MKSIILAVLSVIITLQVSIAQNDIILEINNKKITVDEFLYIYKKNNSDVNAMSYEALKDYMDLFVNFKLKVEDAIDTKLDTVSSFKKEISQYRKQIAQPYLNDSKIEEEIIAEYYDKMQYDVNTRHILIKLPKEPSPDDTIKAFNKINDIYKKLTEGEDFTTVAKEYSEDPSVSKNDGELGYRTVFNFVYEYETAMYNTPVGSISLPFRTEFGYHILQVIDKRPAKGKYNIAHIMKIYPPDASNLTKESVKKQIIEIENKLKAGESFAKLAEENSDDRRTAALGGIIGWITVSGKMIKEFEDAAFALENENDISPIIQTTYGFHIIKLVSKEPIPSFEDAKTSIKNQISNSARIQKSRNAVIEKLKNEYNFTVYPNCINNFYTYVTDSIFEGSWEIDNKWNLDKNLVFTFAGKTFTQKDFANYLEKQNKKQTRKNIKYFVDECFQKYQDEELISYEELQLENKYPDFKYLYNEYHDGILLFELTDKNVWSKSIENTNGLEKFYEENKSDYRWDYRYDVKTYKTKDEKITSKLEKALKKNLDDTKTIDKLNKKDANTVVLENHTINEKNITLSIDSLINKYNIPETDGYVKIIPDKTQLSVIKVIAPSTKNLDESRGKITADYQDYLDKQWVLELREKYPVVVHDDVLKKISK